MLNIKTFKKTTLVVAISAATTMFSSISYAQEEEQALELEEVVVTGSAIKRKDLEGALPLDVLSADQIERTGITNVADLVEKIPSMQGYTTPGDSVGGGGGGLRTASLRGLGSPYTLSLLNGRRMAPADSGSVIDLSNIPVSALKRVEVLKDGASAIYGSDAIAGVVNFILKDEVEETSVNFRIDRPQEEGGGSWGVDLVTGFGNFYDDGYSLVATLSHEEQDSLASVDREFSKTGFINFSHNGQNLYFENSSANSIPGNANVFTTAANGTPTKRIASFNPYRLANGDTCPSQTTPRGKNCRFDYTSTLQILPESERNTLTLNGKLKLTDSLNGYATVLASKYSSTARIAPYPTGQINLPLESALVQNNVIPFLTDEQKGQVKRVTGQWRALPGGNRTTEYTNTSTNFTFGLEGESGNISYDTSLTHAITDTDTDRPDGWLLRDKFIEIATSGQLNIFAGQEDFTDADKAILAPAVYHGDWNDTKVKMTILDGKASMPVFDLSGGEAQVAVGFDYRTMNYLNTLAAVNVNRELLFAGVNTPYELERDQYGLFGEIFLPVLDNVELTASVRYDNISAANDKLNGGRDIDSGDSDTTFKLSGKWDISEAVTLRGSYGTGFKAPSMRQIGEPRSEFGVTSGTYSCPFGAGDERQSLCYEGESQYSVFREGSSSLTFEKSKQYTFGAVVRPTDNIDFTIDYWSVELEDIVDRATEKQIFSEPVKYDSLFTTKINRATGFPELAIIQGAINVADSQQSGIDWSFNYNDIELGFGSLDLALGGTYMSESDNSLYGSSLGRFGDDNDVVFKNIFNLAATLYHGNFTHTLFTNYRSGYDDAVQEVEVVTPGVALGAGEKIDVQLKVGANIVTDYQLRYAYSEKMTFDFGIKNLLDEQPGLTLRTSGAGHQVGWDPRYTDAYGRTFYVSGQFRF